MAKEFNVSLRTVQRDLELLSQTGFPIYSEKGQHSFIDGFSLKKIMLTDEEASLLSFLYEISQSLGGKFKKSFQEILKKVLAPEFSSPFYAKLPKAAQMPDEYPFLKDLEAAIEDSRKAEIYYLTQGKEKRFCVDPLKIIFFDGFWYLLSRIHGKEWIVKFRLENIKK